MEYVWGSNTSTQFEPSFGLRFEWEGADPAPDDDTTLRIRKGERVDPSSLPEKCFLTDAKNVAVPDFFFLDYYILSEKVARIFSEFDLGNGYLHRLQFLDPAGELTHDMYYILVAGNVKSALIPDKSERVKTDNFGRLKIPVMPKDDTLVMSSNALQGPDVWHHQPTLKGLYLSDGLVSELKSQKCAAPFHLFRVKIE